MIGFEDRLILAIIFTSHSRTGTHWQLGTGNWQLFSDN